MCGEAGTLTGVIPDNAGPSPRVRGSLGEAELRPDLRGSIPACAGKPACSPIAHDGRGHLDAGSIPACAGKPKIVTP